MISLSVPLILNTSTFRPTIRAPIAGLSVVSSNWDFRDSERRKPIVAVPYPRSCSSARLGASSSPLNELKPVRLFPGRLRVITKPSGTGSAADDKHNWDASVGQPRSAKRGRTRLDDNRSLEVGPDQPPTAGSRSAWFLPTIFDHKVPGLQTYPAWANHAGGRSADGSRLQQPKVQVTRSQAIALLSSCNKRPRPAPAKSVMNSRRSFDHLVGARAQGRWNGGGKGVLES